MATRSDRLPAAPGGECRGSGMEGDWRYGVVFLSPVKRILFFMSSRGDVESDTCFRGRWIFFRPTGRP